MPVMLLSVVLVGCKGKAGDLVLTDANNYAYAGDLSIEAVEVQPQTELIVDWSAVTVDLRGREVVAADVDQVVALSITDDLETTIDRVENDELGSSLDAPSYLNSGDTSAPLSQFKVLSSFIDLEFLVEDPGQTWIISMLNVDDGINDVLMSTILVPTDGSTNTTLALTNSSASLVAEVDMHSAPPIAAEAGAKAYTLDWTDAETDVFGHDFLASRGDLLMIARYDSEVADIEAGFLQLDTNAAELYQVDVFGLTSAQLEDAVDADGSAFPGFTTDGTWLVALACTTCAHPVPLLLSIVDVE